MSLTCQRPFIVLLLSGKQDIKIINLKNWQTLVKKFHYIPRFLRNTRVLGTLVSLLLRIYAYRRPYHFKFFKGCPFFKGLPGPFLNTLTRILFIIFLFTYSFFLIHLFNSFLCWFFLFAFFRYLYFFFKKNYSAHCFSWNWLSIVFWNYYSMTIL